MKIFKIIAFVVLGAFIFSSCEEKDKTIYNPDLAEESALVMPLSPDGLMFVKDDADELISFSWTESDLGVQVQIDYEVQLSTTNTFDEMVSLFETRESEMDVKVSAVNNALITLELAPGVETTVYCRVLTKVNENVENLVSTVVDYKTTPYETIVDYPMIYVPGAYQGWNPGDENGRLYSYNFDDIYEGIIHITGDDGEFKINDGENWLGGSLVAAGDDYSGTISGDANFSVEPAVYSFRVDMDAMTIELTKTDYWGIIGAAIGGWGDTDDVILHYNGQIKSWTAKAVDFVEGPFKFRANSKWDNNFTGEGNITDRDGDGNIVMSAAGKYDVIVDAEAQTFSVVPTEE